MGNEGQIIKIECKHAYTKFPNKSKILGVGEDTYGIVAWTVTNVIEGEPQVDVYDNIIITGTYEEPIDITKTYTILAKEIEHATYGVQYELMFIGEILNLTSIGNQKAFLQTFLNKNQIEEMFKVLKNPLEVIQKHDIDSLKKVHGIGDYIAEKIIERFEECKDYCNVYLELDGMGLTPKFIQKLISRYNNPNKIIDIIKNNPYQLTFDIEGIGFKKADQIALNNGTDPKSIKRIKGFINYLMEELSDMGDSYILANELMEYFYEEFKDRENFLEYFYDEDGNIIGNNIESAIRELQDESILILENAVCKADRRIYLKKYYVLEKEIAYHLKRITEGENNFNFGDWRELVKLQEDRQGWNFTKEQTKGIEECLKNQLVFITGGAGSGKTSTLSGALQALRCFEGRYSFVQTSLAGKAAARMQEVTGKEGYTIHRLLQFKPPYGFMCNENNPLSYDIVILDEVSLIDGYIFLALLKAIPTGSKLIILGDMGQLESIGKLNIAKDLYESKYIKTIELTQTHRQAQKSGIIVASKSINEYTPLFDKKYSGSITIGELQDMHFDILLKKDSEKIRKRISEYFLNYWQSEKINDIMDIQILSPVKERGANCVMNLNVDIQNIVNPPSKNKKEYEVKYGKDSSFFLREGDKVMNIKNNYNLHNINGIPVDVYNGWVGILTKIDDYNQRAIINYPIINDSISYHLTDLKKHIVLSYASTIHKFQGSDVRIIIGVLDYSTPPGMQTKELLYTLLTRAKEECILITLNNLFYNAVQTSGVSNKNTFLVELLDNN